MSCPGMTLPGKELPVRSARRRGIKRTLPTVNNTVTATSILSTQATASLAARLTPAVHLNARVISASPSPWMRWASEISFWNLYSRFHNGKKVSARFGMGWCILYEKKFLDNKYHPYWLKFFFCIPFWRESQNGRLLGLLAPNYLYRTGQTRLANKSS